MNQERTCYHASTEDFKSGLWKVASGEACGGRMLRRLTQRTQRAQRDTKVFRED